MSAFVALCHADRVELMTDGAAYRPDGTIADLPVKVETILSPPCAITMRGSSYLCDKISAAILPIIEKVGHFDAAMQALDVAMGYLDWLDEAKAYLDDPADGDVDMAIAGVSEANGPTVAYWATRPNRKAGIEPYTVYRYRTGMVTDFPLNESQADSMRKVGGLAGLRGKALEPLRREGRGRPGQYPFIVGGHADLTVVTATDVSTRRVHTWDEDKIGERINPFSADETVVPMPMNRKMRRAAAKRAA